MSFRRDAFLFAGLMACGLACSALADALPDDLGLGMPALPAELRLAAADAMDAPDMAGPGPAGLDLALPEPPPVVVSLLDEPFLTGSIETITLPAPPPAPVVIRTADAVQGALQLRLAEPGSIWPQRLPRKDREAVIAFYARRGGALLWIGDDGWSARTRTVADALGRADGYGLDPAEYPVPVLPPGSRPPAAADLAEAELKLSAAAVLYARDARGGRIEPSRLSGLITPKLELPSTEAVLAQLAGAGDAGTALEGFNPGHAGFRTLKAKLAEIRAGRAGSPMVRRQDGPELTTQAIAILDDAPRPAPLAMSNPRLEGDIVANMERWRWLPADLGDRYVAVNVPEFRLRLIEDGRVAHETRVITGRTETPTPIFSGVMEYAIVNPSWYVPPSILKKEFLPRMAEDPDYAARQGYEVVRRGGAISIRQPPGERNALGFIKFMFPNNHAVYLHDTPNRRLFASARRAFSHGCVRVENPFALADFVLGSEWSEARLKRLIGRGERTIWLPRKLPVHLTYFTVAVDEAGQASAFDDLYGYNRRVRAALGLGA